METKWLKQGAGLLQEIKDTQLSDSEVALWYIGQVGYVIKHHGRILMIDPVLNDMTDDAGRSRRHYREPFTAAEAAENPGVDYVIGTHGHVDHLAPETARGFLHASQKPVFIVPTGGQSLLRQLGAFDSDVIYLTDGACYETTDMRITAISAAHPTHSDDPDDPDMALGYEITLFGAGSGEAKEASAHRIIHLGDTYLTERLYRNLLEKAEPDLLLLPINGDDLFRRMRNCIGNMEAEEAAKLAVRIGAKLAIPTHYDMVMDNTVDPGRFTEELKRLGAPERGRILSLGERIILR